MSGISSRQARATVQHSPAAVVSNATAVPLSVAELWVDYLEIQIDDDNPSGQKALFGDSTLTAASWGLFFYPGDAFTWPFPGPIPVHEIYYYQMGGAGEVRWLGSKRKIPV